MAGVPHCHTNEIFGYLFNNLHQLRTLSIGATLRNDGGIDNLDFTAPLPGHQISKLILKIKKIPDDIWPFLFASFSTLKTLQIVGVDLFYTKPPLPGNVFSSFSAVGKTTLKKLLFKNVNILESPEAAYFFKHAKIPLINLLKVTCSQIFARANTTVVRDEDLL